jgi:hypothetical protein
MNALRSVDSAAGRLRLDETRLVAVVERNAHADSRQAVGTADG